MFFSMLLITYTYISRKKLRQIEIYSENRILKD